MKPRRGVFGLDYIQTAVDLFAKETQNGMGSEESARLLNTWACDVLSQYFDKVESHPVIDAAQGQFDSTLQRLRVQPGQCSPYLRDLTPLPVTYGNMLELAKRRRSVRWYLPKPVPRELIDNAIKVASYSPSACNRQPFEFRVFDDPKLAKEIGSIPMGTRGFFENFPCVVVLVGKLNAFPYERDRHVIYIDAGLAAMAFQFALEVQQLSSCSINWPDIATKEKQITRALSLRPFERVIMLMSVGYPDPQGGVPFSQKKSLDEMRSYNRQ